MNVVQTRSFSFEPRPLRGLVLVRPRRFSDERGWLIEAYNAEEFRQAGLGAVFVQENQSRSPSAGTMRGLHYLARPQAKHLRVISGRVYSVAVDIRADSPTFGAWDGVVLSAEESDQIFIPAGYAHGVCTLEPDTVVAYQLSGHHRPEWERGVRWDDPGLGIAWPWAHETMLVSPKDRSLPRLAEIEPLAL